jgi:hypothetical protein
VLSYCERFYGAMLVTTLIERLNLALIRCVYRKYTWLRDRERKVAPLVKIYEKCIGSTRILPTRLFSRAAWTMPCGSVCERSESLSW